LANDYNRDVFAVPGRVTENTLKGVTTWLKPKADVLTSAADLVYILNWDIQAKTKPVQKQLLSHSRWRWAKSIRFSFKTGKELMDIIALRCDYPFINFRNTT
jgi:DNA processing protein